MFAGANIVIFLYFTAQYICAGAVAQVHAEGSLFNYIIIPVKYYYNIIITKYACAGSVAQVHVEGLLWHAGAELTNWVKMRRRWLYTYYIYIVLS